MENRKVSLAEINPPSTFAMECEVLATLINQADYIPSVEGMLRAELFFDENCRALYGSVMKMYQNRESIDLVTVTPKADRKFLMENIVGKGYSCSELALVDRVGALNEMSQRRKLYYACVKGLQMCVDPSMTAEGLIALPEKLVEDMQSGMSRHTLKSLSEVLNDVATDIQKGAETHISTGFPSLDRLFDGGWGKGQLNILAARPSVGKTAFMLQMVRAAARDDRKALVLSLEMTNDELGKRMLYSTDIVRPIDISTGNLDWAAFEEAVGQLESEKIYLDETPQSLEEVCSAITVAHQRGCCDIAFVDYLQLMSSNDASDSLYRQVTNMTKRMKKLAKALKIPIIMLCQLNRNNVSEKRSPQLHDLRDSGSIEQDCNKCIMLERPTDENGDLGDEVIMWVRKNREGLGGNIAIHLKANNTYTRFYEIIPE